MGKAGQSGYTDGDWADALLAACEVLIENDVTVNVPPNLPIYACELLVTLGVAVQVDDRMPAWRDDGRARWHRQP